MRRRDFLKHGGAAAAGMALGPGLLRADVAPGLGHGILTRPQATVGDPLSREVAFRALDAARSAGAGYADVRVNTVRNQFMATREQRVTGFNDAESRGVGVRVLVDGTWGFAATSNLTADDAAATAARAVEQARANRAAQIRPVELAPSEVHREVEWRSPIAIDPFDIAIEDKVALLLEANAAALTVRGARFASSSMAFVKEEKFYANSEGTVTDQTVHRCWPLMSVTAVSDDRSDFQERGWTVLPRGLGFEYVEESDLVGNAPRWAEEAVQKLSARSVQPGRYDLVLLPSHLALTLHESVAHPTELDRIRGFEANYAGTSFISDPADFLGSFRYGPEFMNIQGERSAHGGLATVGYDDDGVRPDEYLIVKDGVLNDLQTTREQALWLGDWYRSQGLPVRSHGNSYAESWADVQFQRMPNVNLLPHPDRDVTLDEIIGDVEHGIMIDGRGSYSIDQQRYNAQFGGQVFHEIRNGRVVGQLKDVAYQIRTPEFWNALDLLGGASTYELGGTFNDGKGQPSQSNAVSHGCPVTRHRQINVINTGRNA
ncbi:MAG: TldD/PmbA family protein [Longimicrobiales bacterium]